MAYIVNAFGATHSVPDSWLDMLRTQGCREATDEEIATWYTDQGLQNPHATPEPEPKTPAAKRKAAE